ncbi:MAG: sulfurtransferase [Solirubrobacteraceae bacterium]
MLITAGGLQDLLADRASAPTLLDVRWQLAGPPGRQEYERGHIPGAAYIDLDTELAAPPGPGGRHPLPETGVFQAAMRRAGVTARRPVVVYDGATSVAAARAWWLLRYFGHPDVRVLDGGFAAWLEHGGDVATEPADAAPGDFLAAPGGLPVVDADAAARVAHAGILLDVRTPERFRGEHEPIDPIAGHIPEARNLPDDDLLDVTGHFRTTEELRAAFGAQGVRDGVQVATYCGSGVTAAHAILALHLAGVNGALYAGSWSNWITNPTRPVATGD